MINSVELQQLTPHIYWSKPYHETGRPVLGAVVGSQNILMVDAGNSPAHANGFLEAMHRSGLTEPSYIALTHFHWNHVFGAAYLDGLLCSSFETGEHLKEMVRLDWRDKALDQRADESHESDLSRSSIKVEMSNIERSRLKLRAPDITFSDQMIINLGDVTCCLIPVGGDHTHDSTVVYIPEDKVVFLGDCLYSGYINKESVYTHNNIEKLFNTLLNLDAQHFIFAHDDQPMTRRDMEELARTFNKIGLSVAEAKGSRAVALQTLEKEFGKPLRQDLLKKLDAFLSGFSLN